jgi:hypothetical protein
MSIDCGNCTFGSSGPPKLPPTARFMIRKNGWLNTHWLGATFAGVALW